GRGADPYRLEPACPRPIEEVPRSTTQLQHGPGTCAAHESAQEVFENGRVTAGGESPRLGTWLLEHRHIAGVDALAVFAPGAHLSPLSGRVAGARPCGG